MIPEHDISCFELATMYASMNTTNYVRKYVNIYIAS